MMKDIVVQLNIMEGVHAKGVRAGGKQAKGPEIQFYVPVVAKGGIGRGECCMNLAQSIRDSITSELVDILLSRIGVVEADIAKEELAKEEE